MQLALNFQDRRLEDSAYHIKKTEVTTDGALSVAWLEARGRFGNQTSVPENKRLIHNVNYCTDILMFTSWKSRLKHRIIQDRRKNNTIENYWIWLHLEKIIIMFPQGGVIIWTGFNSWTQLNQFESTESRKLWFEQRGVFSPKILNSTIKL